MSKRKTKPTELPRRHECIGVLRLKEHREDPLTVDFDAFEADGVGGDSVLVPRRGGGVAYGVGPGGWVEEGHGGFPFMAGALCDFCAELFRMKVSQSALIWRDTEVKVMWRDAHLSCMTPGTEPGIDVLDLGERTHVTLANPLGELPSWKVREDAEWGLWVRRMAKGHIRLKDNHLDGDFRECRMVRSC
jgi:hypothetical protein